MPGIVTSIRPRDHMITTGKLYPAAWRQAENFRDIRGREMNDWPQWCYLPMGGWYAIVSAAANVDRLTISLSGDIGRLAALGSWRMTQGIYRFDQTLYDEIIKTPIIGDIPCEILYHLPEWCIYIETPGVSSGTRDPLYGFFVHLEYDANDHRHELRLLLDFETLLLPMALHIGEWPIEEALQKMAAEAKRHGGPSEIDQAISEIKTFIEPLVSLILYICSESAEIGDGTGKPKNPKPTKIKGGLRLFAPDHPRVWDIGVRLGAALRRAYAQNTGHTRDYNSDRSRPRAHIRRAHWHTYRTGEKRAGSRLKWLPPIPVNIDDLDNMPATVRVIKNPKKRS